MMESREKLLIEVQGETFAISLNDGAIARPSRGVVADARTWRAEGVIQRGSGTEYRFITLRAFAEMVRNGIFAKHHRNGGTRTETHFANCKPRLYLRDFDHGTYRIWGDGITMVRVSADA